MMQLYLLSKRLGLKLGAVNQVMILFLVREITYYRPVALCILESEQSEAIDRQIE